MQQEGKSSPKCSDSEEMESQLNCPKELKGVADGRSPSRNANEMFAAFVPYLTLQKLDLVNAGGAVLRNNNNRVRPASVPLMSRRRNVLADPHSVEWELAGGNIVYSVSESGGHMISSALRKAL